ncbi:MAG: cytochrome c oxidase subunit 4 [Candidatus Planktophila sp.]
MKANWKLFVGLAVFYAIMAVVYTYVTGADEPVGITGMILASCLAAMVGFYVWFTQKRIGFDIPSDDLNAEIADDAGELGFYSPHSWWPLPVALSACALGLSLVVGWWLTLITLSALIVSIIGFVTEYEKPLPTSSSHH